jgi:predicted ribosome quality control (RQC) complex YloA/Tae2 family protein
VVEASENAMRDVSTPPDPDDVDETLGRVQRVDGPDADRVVLELYHPRHGRRLLLLDARAGELAWIPQRPSGAAADGFVRRLRTLLAGASVLAAEARGARRRLVLQTRAGERVLLTDHEHAPCLRRALDGFPLAGRRRFATELPPNDWTPTSPTASTEAAPRAVEPADRAVRRRLADARRKLARKIRAIEADAARASRVDTLRDDASFVLVHLAHATPGATELVAEDTSVDPPRARRVALDPTRSARAHAERLFHEARRLERGAGIANERLAQVRAEDAALAALEASLDAGAPPESITLALDPVAPRPRAPDEARRPHRVFLGDGDRPIHVGRRATDNDTLTTHARPHDRWLHARGRKGAHVIVPLEKNETCPPALLLDAALLAAHFSDAHADDRVEIQHADRRHVHKRKGSAPGAVTVTHDKTLLLRVDRDRLRWLLARAR